MTRIGWLLSLVACTNAPDTGEEHTDALTAVSTAVMPLDTGVPLEVELTEVDTGPYADLGLEVRTYEHPDGPDTPDGSVPRFLVLRPQEVAIEPVPLLMWMHGGVAALEDDPDYGHLCSVDGVSDMAYGSLQTRHIARRLAEEGAAMVVPVSPWCDLWAGLGDEDPVDSGHASMVHVRQVLRSLENGVDGLQTDPDQTSIWGVSLGALGAVGVAADMQRRGRPPLAVVTDSGPWDVTTLYTAEDSSMPQEWLDHFLGGPPYEEDGSDSIWAENYDRVDAVRLVRDELEVPLFVHHNRFDLIVDEFHAPAMVEALEHAYQDKGVHYAIWNPEHHSPGTYNHTQSNNRVPPMISALDASWRFARGADVRFYEAEELQDLEGTLRDGSDEEHGVVLQASSLETAVCLLAEEGPGMVLRASLPPTLPANLERIVLQWMLVDFDDVPSDEVALEVRLLDLEDDVILHHEVMGKHTRAGLSYTNTEDHVVGATLTFADGLSPRARTLEVEVLHESAGNVFLDGFWAVFPPEG